MVTTMAKRLLRNYDRDKLHGVGADQVIGLYRQKLEEADLFDLVGVRGLAKTGARARALGESAARVAEGRAADLAPDRR